MEYKLKRRWMLLVAVIWPMLTSCGGTAPSEQAPAKTKASYVAIDGSGPPPVSLTSGGNSTPLGGSAQQPLTFSIEGTGNHARHICVPAKSRLILRLMPHPNYLPMLPPGTTSLVNAKTGQLLYDGGPAYYSKLRVRIAIPGTTAAWDYVANNESYSVAGDYSQFLRDVAGTTITPNDFLPTPEYDIQSQTIYGSSATDGVCTYWEAQLHGCTLSSALRASEGVTCSQGQQKLLITNIVSDYPCQNDTVGWCKGGSVQTVPDYQHWALTIQVMTENTTSFL